MTLTAQIRAQLAADYSRPVGFGRKSFSLVGTVWETLLYSFIDGTLAGQIDRMLMSDPLTPPSLAASAFVDIDLSSTLDDPIGDDIPFLHVNMVGVYAPLTNTADLVLGGAAANAWVGPFNATTGKQTVRPGGLYLNVDPGAGWAVTPGTADLWRIANGGVVDPAIYQYLVLGRSV